MAPEPRSITTMRLPADLLRELARIAIRRGVSRTKLVEGELRALVKREKAREEAGLADEDPFA
jgi:predicted transcriptional regulator